MAKTSANPTVKKTAKLSKKEKVEADVMDIEFSNKRNDGKWSSKEELAIVSRVLSRYRDDMIPYRLNSCAWRSDRDITKEWATNWEQYLMSTSSFDEDEDDYKPDIMPHLTFKNVEAIMAEFVDHRLRNRTKPQRAKDVEKTRVFDIILENNANQYDFDTIDQYTAQYMFVTGLSYQSSIWAIIKSTNQYIKSTRDMNEDEKQKFEAEMKLQYESRTVTIHDDIDHLIMPNEEVFVAPEGTRLQGRVNVIPDLVWSRYVGYDDVINMFKFDPLVSKDALNSITTLGQLDSSSYYSDIKPNESTYANSCNLIMHEDIAKDCVTYLVNDTFIKSTPLPNESKNHSVVDFHYLDLPQFHYTPGMASLLHGTESESRVLRNLMYTDLHLDITKITYVDEEAASSLEDGALRREPGLIVPLRGLANMGAKNLMYESGGSGNSASMEVLAHLKDLDDVSSDITGISKQRFGTIQTSSDSATEVQTREASTLKLMMKAILNFAKGKKFIGRLDISWIQQNYKNPILDNHGDILTKEEVAEKDKLTSTKEEYRKIMLEGINVRPTWEGDDKNRTLKSIEVVEEKGWHEFEISADYLDTEKDLEPYIDPEDIKQLTKPMQIQLIQNALAQYSAFAGYKGVPLPNGQMPILDLTKMIVSSIKLQDLPDDWIIEEETTSEESIQIAQAHLEQILQGQFVIGMPGASDEHIDFEMSVAVNLADYIEYLMNSISKEEKGEISIDPMSGMPVMPKPTKQEIELMEKQHILELLNRHIQGHQLPSGTPPDLSAQMPPVGQPMQPSLDGQSIPMPVQGTAPSIEGMQMPQTNMGSQMNMLK